MQDIFENQVIYQPTTFGAPAPQNVGGISLQPDEVQEWLSDLAYGADAVRFLMDAGANPIRTIDIWPPREEYGVLQMHTMGMDFMMNLGTLVDFINELTYNNQRFYKIESLRVVNRNLLGAPDPLLEVQMVLTMASLQEGGTPQAGPEAGGTGGGGGAWWAEPADEGGGFFGDAGGEGEEGGGPTPRVRRRERSWWEKLWPF
jgi:hypothetical protein